MLKEIQSTKLNGGFLQDKFLLNFKTTTNAVYNVFKESGRIDAFKCDWKEGMDKKPHFFWDSDVYKWIEAVAYILTYGEDAELKAKVEEIIDNIEKNQFDDGYFNVFFTVVKPGKRLIDRDAHELYCAGHLIEAACAYNECCGDERLLNIAKKYADFVYKVFVEEKSAGFASPGHEEIEIALVRLYDITKDQKYLDLAKHFLYVRGTKEDAFDEPKYEPKYNQSHLPVKEQKEAVGHAIRALYLYCAMADIALIDGDTELFDTCDTLFDDMTNYKMHVTGGLGQNHVGETFTVKYDLKNDVSYTETCGAIAMILFAERMFKLNPSSKYTDIIELELYNAMMSGLSIDGERFFYTNPLEINLMDHARKDTGWHWAEMIPPDWLPITQRPKVFNCSCCPPNINRTLASITRLFYSADEKDVYINQFADSEYSDNGMKVQVKTDYPNTGKIKVTTAGTENVLVRIPAWCEKFTCSAEYSMENGYAKVKADSFEIEFDMTPQFIMAHEDVLDDANKIAIMRGPVVYCIEGVDNKDALHKLYIDTTIIPVAERDNYFGLPTLTAKGYVRKTENKLYSKLNDTFDMTNIKLIPYYGFANRGETDMRVWLHYK